MAAMMLTRLMRMLVRATVTKPIRNPKKNSVLIEVIMGSPTHRC